MSEVVLTTTAILNHEEAARLPSISTTPLKWRSKFGEREPAYSRPDAQSRSRLDREYLSAALCSACPDD